MPLLHLPAQLLIRDSPVTGTGAKKKKANSFPALPMAMGGEPLANCKAIQMLYYKQISHSKLQGHSNALLAQTHTQITCKTRVREET
jgi:hypothetical protein